MRLLHALVIHVTLKAFSHRRDASMRLTAKLEPYIFQ